MIIPVAELSAVQREKLPSGGRDLGAVYVKFKTGQKAVAPGQAAVFYSGDDVIGGGWIEQGIR